MRLRHDTPDTVVEETTDDEFDAAFRTQPTPHKSSLYSNKLGRPKGRKSVNTLNPNPDKEVNSVLLRNKGYLDVVRYSKQGFYTVNKRGTIYRELVGKRLSRLERRQIIVHDPDGQCIPGSANLWICGGCKRTISIATTFSSKAGTTLGYNARLWLHHKLNCHMLQQKYRIEKAKMRRSGLDERKSDCLCKLVCTCEEDSLEIEKEDLILPGPSRRDANVEQYHTHRHTQRVARRGGVAQPDNIIERDPVTQYRRGNNHSNRGSRSKIRPSVAQKAKANKSRVWRW